MLKGRESSQRPARLTHRRRIHFIKWKVKRKSCILSTIPHEIYVYGCFYSMFHTWVCSFGYRHEHKNQNRDHITRIVHPLPYKITPPNHSIFSGKPILANYVTSQATHGAKKTSICSVYDKTTHIVMEWDHQMSAACTWGGHQERILS